MSSLALVANPIPATFLRGGTSKGIFLDRRVLPTESSQWDRIFLGIMGSPDAQYGRQLNGMGGGVSSLSKICVVGPSTDKEIDVEYTFVQVGIRDSIVDYSGNCGNLSSMIGAFALDLRMCKPRVFEGPGGSFMGTIRSLNLNTSKRVDTTFPILESPREPGGFTPTLDLPQASIAGVTGKASAILLDFVSPGGARTGKLLPSGHPIDILGGLTLGTREDTSISVSLVDATNPTVFVQSRDLRQALDITESSPIDFTNADVLFTIGNIRKAGAVRMGLDPTAQAQPKIAVLSPSASNEADIDIHAFSMGVLHKAIPMTVGLCLGVAAQVPNTIAWEMTTRWREKRRAGELLRIRHPGGIVDVGAEFEGDQSVRSARVMRTGRRLMTGSVWW
ncbi:DUF453-domain-containing protein [Artomyces pyxidatus]|uniref:DUF453-domain-containing protein n=1 Tax=Artomyces pyxidatus TaxID=48021 RepID=A0ACB8TFY8_9AGAM|nr:DUF453-domain-containing protein [Artomyces pyxidatus]